MSLDKLLNSVEKVKEKLSSKEYKKIMHQMGKLNKDVTPMKRIEVIYHNFMVISNDDRNTIFSTMDMVVFYEKEFNFEAIQNFGNWESDFQQIDWSDFLDLLSPDNRRNFFRLQRHKILHNESGQHNDNIMFDDSQCKVFIRVTQQ